jgi:hypothetical protein
MEKLRQGPMLHLGVKELDDDDDDDVVVVVVDDDDDDDDASKFERSFV